MRDEERGGGRIHRKAKDEAGAAPSVPKGSGDHPGKRSQLPGQRRRQRTAGDGDRAGGEALQKEGAQLPRDPPKKLSGLRTEG